jgi:hypothetical protein
MAGTLSKPGDGSVHFLIGEFVEYFSYRSNKWLPAKIVDISFTEEEEKIWKVILKTGHVFQAHLDQLRKPDSGSWEDFKEGQALEGVDIMNLAPGTKVKINLKSWKGYTAEFVSFDGKKAWVKWKGTLYSAKPENLEVI